MLPCGIRRRGCSGEESTSSIWPALRTTQASVSQAASNLSPGGNMEGKQTLSGPEGSAVMTVGTMGATAGATGSALDSYTRPAAPGAFIGILLGENSPDGDRGGGLYSILVLALLAVFVAGLMAGRTPEFLGKKIRAPQMKLIVVYALTIPVAVLILGGTSLMITAGTRSILNPGFHGLSEVSYAFRLGGGQQWVRLRRAGRQHAVSMADRVSWPSSAIVGLRPCLSRKASLTCSRIRFSSSTGSARMSGVYGLSVPPRNGSVNRSTHRSCHALALAGPESSRPGW